MTMPDPAPAAPDVVERLREAARRGKPDGHMMLATNELRNAAAEIERLRAEVAGLRARLAWVDQVYPAALPDGGARVEMALAEFNAMREAIGLPPRKPLRRRA